MPENRVNPLIKSHFSIKVSGYEDVGSVQEVSGVASESEVVELLQSTKGGQQIRIKTLGAQRNKSGSLTLKYAAFKDDKFRAWWNLVRDGKIDDARKNVTITLYESDGKSAFVIDFINCFISSYKLGAFNTKTNDVVGVEAKIEYEKSEIKL